MKRDDENRVLRLEVAELERSINATMKIVPQVGAWLAWMDCLACLAAGEYESHSEECRGEEGAWQAAERVRAWAMGLVLRV